MTNPTSRTDPTANGDRGVDLGAYQLRLRGLSRTQMRWIVGAIVFTLTMIGLKFGAEAIAEIINAIRQ